MGNLCGGEPSNASSAPEVKPPKKPVAQKKPAAVIEEPKVTPVEVPSEPVEVSPTPVEEPPVEVGEPQESPAPEEVESPETPLQYYKINLEEIKGFEIKAQHTIEDGGDTGMEFPKNLINEGEEDWNKWCQIKSNESQIMYKLKQKIKINGIGFKSANDLPERDPTSVRISILGASY